MRPQHYPIVFGITFAAATDCRLNMGKTLEKQRKKAAKAAQEQAQNGVSAAGRDSRLAAIAKKLKYKLPTNPKKKVKLVPLISEALNAQAWDDAQASWGAGVPQAVHTGGLPRASRICAPAGPPPHYSM